MGTMSVGLPKSDEKLASHFLGLGGIVVSFLGESHFLWKAIKQVISIFKSGLSSDASGASGRYYIF